MVKFLARAVLYGPTLYQGIDAKNPFFLQEITHIMAFLNESIYGFSTGNLLQSITETFRVKMGIPFSITDTEYDDNKLYTTCRMVGINCCGSSPPKHATSWILQKIMKTSHCFGPRTYILCRLLLTMLQGGRSKASKLCQKICSSCLPC